MRFRKVMRWFKKVIRSLSKKRQKRDVWEDGFEAAKVPKCRSIVDHEKTLKEFHVFQSLPAEIRHQIWREAAKMASGRVVHFSYPIETFAMDDAPYLFASRTRPPAIMEASRESRSEGMKEYSQITGFGGDFLPFTFDFTRDILFLGRKLDEYHTFAIICQLLTKEELNKVRKLAFQLRTTWGGPSYREVLKNMRGADKLYLTWKDIAEFESLVDLNA